MDANCFRHCRLHCSVERQTLVDSTILSKSTATSGKGFATSKPVSCYLSLLVQPFPVVVIQFEPPPGYTVYSHPEHLTADISVSDEFQNDLFWTGDSYIVARLKQMKVTKYKRYQKYYFVSVHGGKF